eukprot:m.121696 g.121696  ORF g.121696 m.121696 type:complete len:55 (-) comp14584_c0_seq1:2620-2784(-)
MRSCAIFPVPGRTTSSTPSTALLQWCVGGAYSTSQLQDFLAFAEPQWNVFTSLQ